MQIRVLLVLMAALLMAGRRAPAQPSAGRQTFTDARTGYQLTYPRGWLVHESDRPPDISFYTGPAWNAALAVVDLTVRPLPDRRKDRNQLATGQADSLWQAVAALPQAQVLRLEPRDAGSYQEVSYDYTYAAAAPAPPGRTRVVGRRLWRGGYEFRIEYRSAAGQAARYLPGGRQLVESLAFYGPGLPSRRYADQRCDDKMYGIIALRTRDGRVEDDCRTIHEFKVSELSAAPKVHRQVLPFQSYALAKGFDNCLYSVTKAPTDRPEYVYRYNPATRQGAYTAWRLPAQGPENFWIAAATNRRGDLYFLSNNARLLVRVSPTTDSVNVVWSADPLRRAPYYRAVEFPGAGTHGNFCLDETTGLYEIYSADGTLLFIDLRTQQPGPELIPLNGLPESGGYSDVLIQQENGQRVLYLAGLKAIYRADLARRQAARARRGTYTDLAGCNLFRPGAAPGASPPPPPTTATWRGRVLDAATLQPLPQAQLRLRVAAEFTAKTTAVPLAADGRFSAACTPGLVYGVQASLAGYLTTDTAYTARPGSNVQDILLRPAVLAVGAILRLDNVQFAQSQAVLLPSSFPALDQLVALLTANPGLTIELRGHTDNVGDPQKNVALSQERVAAVKAYLVRRSVAAERISGIGLGGAEPRASNDQESTRRLNRRVEFRVTGR